MQPLVPLGQKIPPQPVTHATLLDYVSGPVIKDLQAYFHDYPRRSLMSSQNRCVVYGLIRMMQPSVVVEVGTFYAGTTEVMARALQENDKGAVYTTDPFGADRCPGIFAAWPVELQQRVRYSALNSMDFFLRLEREGVVPDLVLVDGNHDYEFALFDLQMAARFLRPGGIVLMDNAEQSGPFNAARVFLSLNPLWRELGHAVADHDPSHPFDGIRASLPETSFIILQAPEHRLIGEASETTSQRPTTSCRLDGLRLDLPEQVTAGTLHYQAYLRSFYEDGRVFEERAIGSLRIAGAVPATIDHEFKAPLECPEGAARYSTEFDLSWEADAGAPPLVIKDVPRGLVRPTAAAT
jgi:predicted O-methyltransferase YrrM